MKKMWIGLLLLLLSAIAFGGCGQGDQKETSTDGGNVTPPEKLQPVTLKLFPNQPVSEDDFNKLIAEPVKKKYPNITVEMMTRPKDKYLPDFVASGEQMDLITNWNGLMPSYKELGIYEDLTPLAKKFNFDLNRFDQGALDAIKEVSDNKELYGLPYGVQFNALYYNKDVFDKFGVPYPQDGMTWEDAIELAKKVTRTEGGVQYRGLDPDSLTRMLFPLSLNVVDAKTDKPLVTGEPYRRVFELTKSIYAIPGNRPKVLNQNATNAFIKEKNVAMLTTVNQIDRLKVDSALNWDIAQYPSYKERPNVYGMFDMHVITIPKTSKHKEDAMRVLEVLFSDDVQMISTRQTGRVSPLKDPKFAKAFGAEIPALQGKRVASIFKSKPAPAPRFSIYYAKSISLLTSRFYDFVDGKKDLNTALREADEQITQYIAGEKSK